EEEARARELCEPVVIGRVYRESGPEGDRTRPRLNGFETRSAPFTSFSQARPQRVDHPYFAVLLTCPEVFGIQGRGTRAFGCLENQRVPVGDLVARLDFQRLNDRFRTVDDDFPA